MNLYELDALIASIQAGNINGQDNDLIQFYLMKRAKLVMKISAKVTKGLRKL